MWPTCGRLSFGVTSNNNCMCTDDYDSSHIYDVSLCIMFACDRIMSGDDDRVRRL